MTGGEAGALVQVVGIDALLGGDNAIAIGALATTVAPPLRRRAMVIGIGIAMAVRIVASLGVAWLFALPGVTLVGGVLLLAVAWKLGREAASSSAADGNASAGDARGFGAAIAAIVAADISLSLDNVLGVAGAARNHPLALAVGLVFSILLMGIAATVIGKVIERHRWIAWVGVGLILLVAFRMILAGLPAHLFVHEA